MIEALTHVFGNAKGEAFHNLPPHLHAACWHFVNEYEDRHVVALCWCMPKVSYTHGGTRIEVAHRDHREDQRDI